MFYQHCMTNRPRRQEAWQQALVGGKRRYEANLCPFYGVVAANWSMLIRSILHKRGADFKRFLGGLTDYLQVLTTQTLVECSQVRQIERKEEIRTCPAMMRD